MGGVKRSNRWVIVVLCLVFVAIVISPFAVRDTATLSIVLVALTIALLGLVIVRLFLQARSAVWRRDAWLVRNAQPRLNAILLIGQGLVASMTVVLGLVFVHLGYAIGWAVVVAGGGWGIVIGITRWLSRQPGEAAPEETREASD